MVDKLLYIIHIQILPANPKEKQLQATQNTRKQKH